MNLLTETLQSCPVCSGTHLHRLMLVPDFETSTGDYGLVECADCGVAFTNPRPVETELPRLYAKRDTSDFPAADRGLVNKLRDLAINAFLRREMGPVRGGTESAINVLDFGCGDGALARRVCRLVSASGGTARVTAVDFHESPPPALANGGDGIRYLSQRSWRAEHHQYDLVFLRHVLEHHPDPLRLLTGLRCALRANGRLVIEVPNRRSVWASVCGRFYSGYYIPRHLFHFDQASLRDTVARSGLRCLTLHLGHTPLLGNSIAYRTGWKVGNLGLVGLATYPLQVAMDLVAGRSSTLRLVATPDA